MIIGQCNSWKNLFNVLSDKIQMSFNMIGGASWQ